MDETTVRTLLAQIAAEPAPPSAVDIAAARGHGRRRLRWRRAGLAAAPLAAAAAAALIVTGTVPLGGNGHAPVAPRPATPQAPIPALAPSASFGWLPAGFSMRRLPGLAGPDWWFPRSLTVNAWSPATGRVLTLEVRLLSNCHLRLIPHLPQAAAARFALDCANGSGGQVTATAPMVRGARAYWTAGGGLLWQYRPGVWAKLSPGTLMPPGRPTGVVAGWQPKSPAKGSPATVQPAATRALLRKVAAHVSYGATAVLFPFRLTGLPANWRPNIAQLTTAGGRLLDTSLMLGPASNLGALTISATPLASAGRSPCGKFISGQPEYVTIGGARGYLRTIDRPHRHEQDLCLASYHGWSLKLYLRTNVSGSSQPLPGAPSGVLAVLRHLRLLGQDPATWTRTPLG